MNNQTNPFRKVLDHLNQKNKEIKYFWANLSMTEKIICYCLVSLIIFYDIDQFKVQRKEVFNSIIKKETIRTCSKGCSTTYAIYVLHNNEPLKIYVSEKEYDTATKGKPFYYSYYTTRITKKVIGYTCSSFICLSIEAIL